MYVQSYSVFICGTYSFSMDFPYLFSSCTLIKLFFSLFISILFILFKCFFMPFQHITMTPNLSANHMLYYFMINVLFYFVSILVNHRRSPIAIFCRDCLQFYIFLGLFIRFYYLKRLNK